MGKNGTGIVRIENLFRRHRAVRRSICQANWLQKVRRYRMKRKTVGKLIAGFLAVVVFGMSSVSAAEINDAGDQGTLSEDE